MVHYCTLLYTTVQCAVCSVQCAVCSVQCAVCSVQCAVCSVQCAVCSVQCIGGSGQWAVPVSIHRHIERSPPLNPEGLDAARVQAGQLGKLW